MKTRGLRSQTRCPGDDQSDRWNYVITHGYQTLTIFLPEALQPSSDRLASLLTTRGSPNSWVPFHEDHPIVRS